MEKRGRELHDGNSEIVDRGFPSAQLRLVRSAKPFIPSHSSGMAGSIGQVRGANAGLNWLPTAECAAFQGPI